MQLVTELQQVTPPLDYVVINDGSTDNTLSILQSNAIPYINLPLNLGIGGVVQTGYRFALEHGYDIAVQVDGDGQHDPSLIHQLVRPLLQDETDVVIGSRFLHADGYKSTFMRRLGINWISHIICLCSGIRIYDTTSGFRAVNRRMIEFYAQYYTQDYPEPEAILNAALCGYRLLEVPTTMRERTGGTSSINALRSVYYMIKVTLALLICRMSSLPRRNDA